MAVHFHRQNNFHYPGLSRYGPRQSRCTKNTRTCVSLHGNPFWHLQASVPCPFAISKNVPFLFRAFLLLSPTKKTALLFAVWPTCFGQLGLRSPGEVEYPSSWTSCPSNTGLSVSLTARGEEKRLEGEIEIQASKHNQAHSQMLFAFASRDTLPFSSISNFFGPLFFLFHGCPILSFFFSSMVEW